MEIKGIIEALLFAADKPVTVAQLQMCFPEYNRPEKSILRAALNEVASDYKGRSVELNELASGFRFQVRKEFSPWVSRLLEERPAKYSRALLETLAIIAYQQPTTRGGIEEIRGVTVSTGIIRTLLDRGWVRVVGHKEVPGRPALYATTKEFLDHFNLKSLNDLPTLLELEIPEAESDQLIPDELVEDREPDEVSL